ncbi:putative glycosyl hydrolase 43 family protein [Lyophyllum shimeji]|uniref:Glycosyl hydrolase 43 family protein n=1 Tax=Lyophyllum shimeji TaxID=47721 RepID=A0A9P3PXW5_LYOSH|nr:putative glycosyl hydrolase 43 family protein [Lyophyllum shimeji]
MSKLIVLLGLLSAFAAAVTGNAIVERQASPKAAYGFVYFTGEGTANGEQIYFAMYNSGMSWDQASRRGSRSLAIWESPDLKTWSAQRLVQVAPPEAGMAWAPEATYDSSTGKFVVYWASKLYATSDTNHTGTSYARILYATTTDFKTFSTPAVWIDPGRDIHIETLHCIVSPVLADAYNVSIFAAQRIRWTRAAQIPGKVNAGWSGKVRHGAAGLQPSLTVQ